MPTVDEMRIILDVETARMGQKLAAVDRQIGQFQASTGQRLASIDGFFRKAGVAALAYFGGKFAHDLVEYANAWTRVTRALEASEDIFGIRLRSAEALTVAANRSRIDLEAFGKVYVRTAASIRDYGYTEETAIRVTESLSKALKLGTAEASEQASVLLQFSQALQKGKLDGDEFRSVMENAGVVQELLADKLRVSKGEIVTMAAEGKLKVRDLVGALVDGGEKIDRIFAKTPATVDEAFVVMKNALTAYIGKVDQATGASKKLAESILYVANNLDDIVAMSGAIQFLFLYTDRIKMASDGNVTAKDTMKAVAAIIGQELLPALQSVVKFWSDFTAALAGATDATGEIVPESMSGVMEAVKVAVNFTVGQFMFAAKMIKAVFLSLPPAIGDVLIQIANMAAEAAEKIASDMARMMAGPAGLVLPAPQFDFGRVKNPFEGMAKEAQDAFSDAFRQIGRDFVGELDQSIKGIGERIRAKAEEIAAMRRWAEGTRFVRNIELKQGKEPFDKKEYEKRLKAYEEAQEVYKKALEATEQYVAAAGEEYDKELRKFKKMLDEKLLTEQQYNQVRINLAHVAFKEYQEALEKEWKRLRDVTDAVAGQMEKAFEDFARTGKLNFRDFTQSVLIDIAKIAFRMMVLRPLFGEQGKGFGLVGDALGLGGKGGLLGQIFGGFKAGGGAVSPSKGYIVGERGPEWFQPNVSGRIIPQVPQGGGVALQLVMNLDARGAYPESVEEIKAQLRQFERTIPARAVEAVRDARARGIR